MSWVGGLCACRRSWLEVLGLVVFCCLDKMVYGCLAGVLGGGWKQFVRLQLVVCFTTSFLPSHLFSFIAFRGHLVGRDCAGFFEADDDGSQRGII